MERLALPDVTLFSLDTDHTALTDAAIATSMEQSDFGDVLRVSCDPSKSLLCRSEYVQPFASAKEHGAFFLKETASRIRTPFLLSIQWDGFIVDPSCWIDSFLHYDYIGARWPWHQEGSNVGNSGFSLWSKKLLEILGQEYTLPDNLPGDFFICHVLRPELERKYGIRFAPSHIADLFSYERHASTHRTFGFHGMFNMSSHIPDEQVEFLAENVAKYVVTKVEFAELMSRYFVENKPDPLKALCKRLSREVKCVKEHLINLGMTETIADELILLAR